MAAMLDYMCTGPVQASVAREYHMDTMTSPSVQKTNES